MKTQNFDTYLQEKLEEDHSLAKGLEEAGKIIDVSFQIYTIRKRKGLTQTQLAKKTGMHQSNIARLEDASYAHVPSGRTLEKIARALGVDVTTLFTPPYKKVENQKIESILSQQVYRISYPGRIRTRIATKQIKFPPVAMVWNMLNKKSGSKLDYHQKI